MKKGNTSGNRLKKKKKKEFQECIIKSIYSVYMQLFEVDKLQSRPFKGTVPVTSCFTPKDTIFAHLYSTDVSECQREREALCCKFNVIQPTLKLLAM